MSIVGAIKRQFNDNTFDIPNFLYYFDGCCCCFKQYIIVDSAFVPFEPRLNKEGDNDRFYFCGSSR